MEKYDYYNAVKEDILNAIEEDDELLPREDEDAVVFMSNICSADVTIRCYILPSVIHDIIEEKHWFNDDEEED